ncbi:serine--tRNA ligase [Candidatus Woesearchaeota archaeon]|nr:serine--tRNA ligase [Candidatus Woesearchaeota archaeon]
MLDINLLREKPEIVRENLKKRFQKDKITLVDETIKKDQQWRELKKKSDDLRARRNTLSQEINQAKKNKKDASKLIEEASKIPDKIKQIDQEKEKLEKEIQSNLKKIPNIIHKNVPIGRDENENKVIKTIGKPIKPKFKLANHGDLLETHGQADFETAAKISGAGFYFLKNKIAWLNQALLRYSIDFLRKKGYTYVEPPLMLRKEPYSGVVEMSDFENVMYKIENEDLYLIATSEHPLIAQFMNTNIPEEQLPIKLVGYSMCFRKEIGSHGVDTKGLFRTHQFNKVEQIIICKPEDSWKYFEELLKNTEEIFNSLEMPYQLLEMCSGDLGTMKAKQIDLELWMAKQGKYQEATSLSNCTDYQARQLDIKSIDKNFNKTILHTLNNTAIATSRVLVGIIENFQQADGTILIPKALHKYTGFKSV